MSIAPVPSPAAASLPSVPLKLSAPPYARSSLRRSIVHIGVGAFHRAHLAAYVDGLLRDGLTSWAIVGAGVLASDRASAAAARAQDCLYTLTTRGRHGSCTTFVGSIVEYVHAPPGEQEGVVAAIAAKETQVVSLTITEAGYPVDDGDGRFDGESAQARDGAAFDVLVRGLDARRRGGGGGVTVLSCDNVVSNGAVARVAAYGMAARLDGGDGLVGWMRENVSFPNSMVDRITPAAGESDRLWVRERFGVEDRWPVVAEEFRMWVVEDCFAGERMPLERMGAIVTADVEPYERVKLRLLNAGHCCLAYAAAVLGYEFVHDAMSDEGLAAFIRAFLEREAAPMLDAPPGIVLSEYVEQLLERFGNVNVRDQVGRLCLDASAKLPKFLFPTIRAQLRGAGKVSASALLLASWAKYLLGKNEAGASYALARDGRLEEAVEWARVWEREPGRFLEFGVFPEEWRRETGLTEAFAWASTVVQTRGMRAAIESLLA